MPREVCEALGQLQAVDVQRHRLLDRRWSELVRADAAERELGAARPQAVPLVRPGILRRYPLGSLSEALELLLGERGFDDRHFEDQFLRLRAVTMISALRSVASSPSASAKAGWLTIAAPGSGRRQQQCLEPHVFPPPNSWPVAAAMAVQQPSRCSEGV